MAEEEKKEAAPEKKEATSVSGGKSPLVTALLLLNAIGMGAIGFMQFKLTEKINSQPSIRDVVKAEVQAMSGEEGEAGKDPASVNSVMTEGVLLPLDGFTANLAHGDGPRRFIRLNAVLKFSKDSKEAEFNARKPQIRDSIISILNSKRPEDLLKQEGKNFLKEEIKSAINSFLIEGSVIDVFYVGFQIN